MAINLVVQSGQVKNLALRYAADGKPELRFTLIQQEGTWPLYLPCCAVGAAAERLASEIDADMYIVISSGRLCYRKRANKSGVEASRMEILVWSVDRLTTLPQDERLPHAEGGVSRPPDGKRIQSPSHDADHIQKTRVRVALLRIRIRTPTVR